jgi:hypothetical protein
MNLRILVPQRWERPTIEKKTIPATIRTTQMANIARMRL